MVILEFSRRERSEKWMYRRMKMGIMYVSHFFMALPVCPEEAMSFSTRTLDIKIDRVIRKMKRWLIKKLPKELKKSPSAYREGEKSSESRESDLAKNMVESLSIPNPMATTARDL